MKPYFDTAREIASTSPDRELVRVFSHLRRVRALSDGDGFELLKQLVATFCKPAFDSRSRAIVYRDTRSRFAREIRGKRPLRTVEGNRAFKVHPLNQVVRKIV